jgi:hypothetical protein
MKQQKYSESKCLANCGEIHHLDRLTKGEQNMLHEWLISNVAFVGMV